MRWLDEVLAPAKSQLTKRQWERLRAVALALTLGIDAVVVMKDVCHLDDDATEATLRWTAMALLHTARSRTRSRPALTRGSPGRSPGDWAKSSSVAVGHAATATAPDSACWICSRTA